MNLARDLAFRALRRLDPETAHGLTLSALRAGLGPRDTAMADEALAINLAGIELPHPIGLAAGFDKNAEAPDALLKAGFAFVECGTTTPLAQAGNPRPRLFRLASDRAVINRMGFNNDGEAAFAGRLARRRRSGVVGANIGANKDSADRVADYVAGLRRLWGLCDYFTLNVSSPNTPGLRALQGASALADLLGAVSEERAALTRAGAGAPIFLKVAPDLDDREVEGIARTAEHFGLDGLIVGNTTLARPASLTAPARKEAGGLSGAPLMAASTRVLGLFHDACAGRLCLVGVGGVATGGDAYAKIRAGASAVQLYTALVYGGPRLVGDITRDLGLRLKADGFSTLAEAVGAR
jgi:dihydroorotate dehydrogenase